MMNESKASTDTHALRSEDLRRRRRRQRFMRYPVPVLVLAETQEYGVL